MPLLQRAFPATRSHIPSLTLSQTLGLLLCAPLCDGHIIDCSEPHSFIAGHSTVVVAGTSRERRCCCVCTGDMSVDEDDVPLGSRSTAQLRQRSRRVRRTTPGHAPGSDADEDGEQLITSDDGGTDEYKPSDSEILGDEQVRCES